MEAQRYDWSREVLGRDCDDRDADADECYGSRDIDDPERQRNGVRLKQARDHREGAGNGEELGTSEEKDAMSLLLAQAVSELACHWISLVGRV